jgi:hypothetical protein
MYPITKYYSNFFIILCVIFIVTGLILIEADSIYYWIVFLGVFIMIAVIFQFGRFVKKRKDNE